MNIYLFVILALIINLSNPSEIRTDIKSRYPMSDTLKAQIDITIHSGNKERYAKSFDKIKAGDKIQIYIKPEVKSYLWIISSSKEKTSILLDSLLTVCDFYIFPTNNNYFVFDGKSYTEKIIIILSIHKESKNKFENIKDDELLDYIDRLESISACDISEKSDEIINISGNLREVSGNENRMSKYSGIRYLIKEFKFNVKK